jgi:hypothetical protein
VLRATAVNACGSNEPLRVSVAAKLGYMRGYMRGPWYYLALARFYTVIIVTIDLSPLLTNICIYLFVL